MHYFLSKERTLRDCCKTKQQSFNLCPMDVGAIINRPWALSERPYIRMMKKRESLMACCSNLQHAIIYRTDCHASGRTGSQ